MIHTVDYGDPLVRHVRLSRPLLMKHLYNPPSKGRWLLAIDPHTLVAAIVLQQPDGYVPEVEGHEDLFPLLMALERADGFIDRGDWLVASTPEKKKHDGIYCHYQIIWIDPNVGVMDSSDERLSHPSALQIFICHASDDKRQVIDLYNRLELQGYSPWLDVQRLIAGHDWHTTIKEAIFNTDVIIVCVSERMSSKSGFVHDEIAYAVSASEFDPQPDGFIIPVLFEPCILPRSISKWHAVHYFEVKGWDALVYALRTRSSILELRTAKKMD